MVTSWARPYTWASFIGRNNLRRRSRMRYGIVSLVGAALLGAQTQPSAADPRAFLDKYCVTCHNQKLHTAGLALDTSGRREAWRQCGGVGAGDREAAGRLDAAARNAAAGCGHLSRRRELARKRNRSRVGGQSESGQDQRGPSSQSRGIQQRDSRPVRARPRCEAAAARAMRRRTAASTTSRMSSRFRRRTWSDTCRWPVR